MPVQRNKDSIGCFYRWGNHGKKYYYIPNNKKSRMIAKNKASKQGKAIKAQNFYRNQK